MINEKAETMPKHHLCMDTEGGSRQPLTVKSYDVAESPYCFCQTKQNFHNLADYKTLSYL